MKYFYIIIGFLLLKINVFATLKDGMVGVIDNDKKLGINETDTGALDQVFLYVKDFIFTILWIIGVGVFLYFGFKMISARGNPEELKKTLMGFVYAVIGLAIIPLAYGMVKLISSLNF